MGVVFPPESELNRRANALVSYPLFASLSASDRREVASSAREQGFSRRQTIHLEGDPIRQVVLLTSGYAKVVQCGPSGTEVILRLAGPGEVVGSIATGSELCHASTAQALSTSTAMVWDAAKFEQSAQHFPVIRRNLTRILGQRLEELEARFREISTEKVAVRLSSQMIRLLTQGCSLRRTRSCESCSKAGCKRK